jgi:hypothetical protein
MKFDRTVICGYRHVSAISSISCINSEMFFFKQTEWILKEKATGKPY